MMLAHNKNKFSEVAGTPNASESVQNDQSKYLGDINLIKELQQEGIFYPLCYASSKKKKKTEGTTVDKFIMCEVVLCN